MAEFGWCKNKTFLSEAVTFQKTINATCTCEKTRAEPCKPTHPRLCKGCARVVQGGKTQKPIVRWTRPSDSNTCICVCVCVCKEEGSVTHPRMILTSNTLGVVRTERGSACGTRGGSGGGGVGVWWGGCGACPTGKVGCPKTGPNNGAEFDQYILIIPYSIVVVNNGPIKN